MFECIVEANCVSVSEISRPIALAHDTDTDTDTEKWLLFCESHCSRFCSHFCGRRRQ